MGWWVRVGGWGLGDILMKNVVIVNVAMTVDDVIVVATVV